jgi:two-component system, LytTR family, sensor kinase
VTRRRVIWILSVSFCTAVGLLCGLQIWISMISHGHALWRVLTYQVLTWDAWIVIGVAIAWLARRFALVPPSRRAIAIHLGAALAIAAVHSLWWATLLVTIRPYDAMGPSTFVGAVSCVMPSGLPQELICYCAVLAACHAVDYYDKFR